MQVKAAIPVRIPREAALSAIAPLIDRRPWLIRSLSTLRRGTTARGRRVALLLGLLWLLNAFDLACTLMVRDTIYFHEANPIFRPMLEHPHLVFLCKASAIVFATMVLGLWRRRWYVECACWGLCLVYGLLSFVWMHCITMYSFHITQVAYHG